MRLGPQALWPKMRAASPVIHQASRKAALPPFISVSLRETNPFPLACLMRRAVIISEDCPPFPLRLIPRGAEAQYLMLDQLIYSILGADG